MINKMSISFIFIFLIGCIEDNGLMVISPSSYNEALNPQKFISTINEAKKKHNGAEAYHNEASYNYGYQIGSPVWCGIFKTGAEIGQFIYFSLDDITRRVMPGGKKKGKYQPYKYSYENGGIKDSMSDIRYCIKGAQAKKEEQALDALSFYSEKEVNKKFFKGFIVIGAIFILL